jgi:hypothetical protein
MGKIKKNWGEVGPMFLGGRKPVIPRQINIREKSLFYVY